VTQGHVGGPAWVPSTNVCRLSKLPPSSCGSSLRLVSLWRDADCSYAPWLKMKRGNQSSELGCPRVRAAREDEA
jgi:hypothetical protein